ncbi:Fpg/Nei family DNA glycosylase [Amycolatopsis echigonensis]|uniref:Formamidopyrimidine-DNA glycosylase n=1 Tax=Amycolatopsis echigonensis TaxID=2576905 RepID=A0A2N3WG65_9PSEU|nr:MULTISPECIES: DNA-formamidopyrimidine glycosylase family protein [Amycolatopsis]MBB2497935.1 Fpg/Nei family DNA glycosylase [Amycolatopsis echigonensis]PKV92853.1 formamidopyrimidine-DNA glycosylase [Amycolatopsis niigatensis]
MPELPEVEALAHHLREHAVGSTVFRLDVASLSVLKTAVPPYTELHGREITDATRHGKHLDIVLGDLHLVVHLARAGWLRWSDALSPAPLKPGKGPISLRVHLESASGPGFDLTEAGTKKGLAVWIVADPSEVASVARLGPDALAIDASRLRELFQGKGTRLKWALTDQSVIAGIGNAYSDEIMHRAKLSPYATVGKLDEGALEVLAEAIREVETDAVERSVGQKAARLKGEKRSGLRVHARTGLPCPVCGDTIREISFADKSFQYCATCQTGGKPLADRRMSRLLK